MIMTCSRTRTRSDRPRGLRLTQRSSVSPPRCPASFGRRQLTRAQAYDRAKSMLLAHRKQLDDVASALLKHETLTAEDIKLVAEGKSLDR